LIISGHAAFWCLAPLALQSYYPKYRCVLARASGGAGLDTGLEHGWGRTCGWVISSSALLHSCIPAFLQPVTFASQYCLSWSPSPHPHSKQRRWVSVFLWLAFTHTSIRDIIDKQHYSVDMLLAAVVTTATWHWLEWVYPPSRPLARRAPGAKPDPPHPAVLGLIAFALFAACIIVIGGHC